jgi:Protein of unknown function (DUF3223)
MTDHFKTQGRALLANGYSIVPWFKTEGVLGVPYKSQAALRDACRAIINPKTPGTRLSPSEQVWMLDLLRHHHAWEEKRGSGVEAIEVRLSVDAVSVTKCLWLIRTDGTAVDISWFRVVVGRAQTYGDRVRNAARNAIGDQTQAVRERERGGDCPICSKRLTGLTHVDHHPVEFETLIADWLRERELPLVDAGTESAFANEADRTDWREYHDLFANLRLVHKKCNLSKRGATP